MAEFIISPGQTGTLTDTSPSTVKFTVTGKTGPLEIVSLTDLSMSMSKDLFTRTQMNFKGKRQFPTTSAYALTGNISIEKAEWEGVVADVSNVAGSASVLGLFGLITGGVRVTVEWNMGATKYRSVSGGYVTGATPAVSADSPIWVSPITITIDGDIEIVE